MKLYLSSYLFGNNPSQMRKMTEGTKSAVIINAIDGDPTKDRAGVLKYEMDGLRSLGFEPEEIDLRAYFGKREELTSKLSEFDFVWVRGGNVFVLRRAFKMSGADWALFDMIKNEEIVYGGYSAGICVLQKDLHGLELVDDPNLVPDGYITETIWEGMKIFTYSFAPHYKSNTPDSEAMEKVIVAYHDKLIKYVTLGDGEVLVINGSEEFVDF